jgi:hypothetical protein
MGYQFVSICTKEIMQSEREKGADGMKKYANGDPETMMVHSFIPAIPVKEPGDIK